MTGEDVMKGAELLQRWRHFHRLRSLLATVRTEPDIGNRFSDALLVLRDPDVIRPALAAATEAAGQRLDELIREAHEELAGMGVGPPFPGHEIGPNRPGA